MPSRRARSVARAIFLAATCCTAALHAPSTARACDPTQWGPPDSMAAAARAAPACLGGAPAGEAATAAGGWSHLVSLETNSYNADCNPWLTADGKHLFFITWDGKMGPPRPGFQGSWDIYEAQWDEAHGRWGEPVNVGPPINTPGADRRPSATSTGDTLFFSRTNVMVSVRSGGVWGTPVTLFAGSDPCITSDLAQIYFVRNNDIWVADRGSDIYHWINLRSIGSPVNTPQYAEVRPFITFDKTKLYWSDFGGSRPGGFGGADLWFSTWTGSAWGPPVNVGPPVNTDRSTCTPYVTRDGRRLYTASEAFEGSRGDEDVWVAFLDSVPVPRDVPAGGGVWMKCGELAGAWNVYDLAEGPDGALYAGTAPAGLVYRSDDAGATWNAVTALPGARIVYSVLVASDGALYAGTYPQGDVFRSADRGATWQPTANIPGATTVRALIETNDQRILAGVSPTGAVFASSNAGQTWTSITQLQGLVGNGVTCLRQTSNGYIYAGGWGPPYRSTDGGATWATVNNLPFPPNEMRSFDSFYETRDAVLWATGWVHGHGGYVFKSLDAGVTWDTTGTIHIGPVRAVRAYALDEDGAGNLRVGYQPGPDSVACVSADRGATWRVEAALAGAHEIFAFLRTSSGALYAGTTPNGDIFRWRSVTDASEAEASDTAAVLQLRPAVPNPSRSGVRLAYRIRHAGHAVLEVVDAQGRRVRTLFDGRREAGEDVLAWDGCDDAGRKAAGGVYFARLQLDGRVQSRKITLVP